jgi:cytochrome c-type biogenesis protein CcmH/NrfF
MSSIVEAVGAARARSRDLHAALASFIVMLVLGFFVAPGLAGEAAPAAQDPALEARVNALSNQLRCLVCQNQTIAESNAGLAVDLKNQVRERLQKGESESQIIDFMVARYGDFVLYRPPFKMTTLILWLGPLLLVITGLLVLYRRLKSVSRQPQTDLSAADRKRAERLLAAGRKEAP